jgi:voltage-gated potassium channel Kch
VQSILRGIKGDNDASGAGYMHLFNPSSTTFVKHFIAVGTYMQDNTLSETFYTAGYGNTTSAVDAVQFSVNSGNIDAGTITLYGIN